MASHFVDPAIIGFSKLNVSPILSGSEQSRSSSFSSSTTKSGTTASTISNSSTLHKESSDNFNALLKKAFLVQKQKEALANNKTFIPSFATEPNIYKPDPGFVPDVDYYRDAFNEAIHQANADVSNPANKFGVENTTIDDIATYYIFCVAKLINFANPYTPKAFQHEILPGEWAQFVQGEDGATERVWVYWNGVWNEYATN
ncbi:hypothetical protein GLAREA_12255 [Glarea lozoyensis ATCC 20868]|uniref:Uncharacterized protein n=1 Tax=Glarea lozoyensis (strain ATCC 20868 / MF5171) TaxID=1116229 RepID=S3D2V4_GLAL2|nr:uncharacterized protein GLAREA_12255 [Glarea lozoyensis ATCC 20868]EPE31499.1 hypothetical protein GLAREA_12255 [Glarea lozoyensis ATCC 20868]